MANGYEGGLEVAVLLEDYQGEGEDQDGEDSVSEDSKPLTQVFQGLGKRKAGRSNLTDQARRKHKKVCPEDAIAAGEKEFFQRSVTQSRAFEGLHSRVQSQTTFGMYWRAYRAYVGHLLAKDRVKAPVYASDALTTANIRLYFQDTAGLS